MLLPTNLPFGSQKAGAGWQQLSAIGRFLFYVMAECWGSIVYTVLFWGLANEVTRLSDAIRFYPLLILAGNLSAIAAGEIAIFLTPEQHIAFLPFGHTAWEQTLILLTALILSCGIAVLMIYKAYEPLLENKQWTGSVAEKMSFRSSLNYLLQSRYLLSIAMLVFFYHMVINLAEVEWKNQIVKVYPEPKH